MAKTPDIITGFIELDQEQRLQVGREDKIQLSFRVSQRVLSWFKNVRKRNPRIKKMKGYLMHLLIQDGFKPTGEDF